MLNFAMKGLAHLRYVIQSKIKKSAKRSHLGDEAANDPNQKHVQSIICAAMSFLQDPYLKILPQRTVMFESSCQPHGIIGLKCE